MRKPRVLIAGTPRAIGIIEQSLGGAVELVRASAGAEALACCRESIALVVTHVSFDESRMLDFVQALRAQAPERAVPVICLRLLSPLSPRMREAIVEALEVLGATRFIDLYEMRERLGEDAARRQLTQLLLEECARLQP